MQPRGEMGESFPHAHRSASPCASARPVVLCIKHPHGLPQALFGTCIAWEGQSRTSRVMMGPGRTSASDAFPPARGRVPTHHVLGVTLRPREGDRAAFVREQVGVEARGVAR